MKQRLPLLPMSTLHTNKFCLEIQKPVTILDMAKCILNQEEIDLYCKKFKKQIHTWIFAFKIKHEEREWVLYKKIQQFEEFQDQMRKKFGREIPALPIKKSKEVKSINVVQLSEFLLIFLNKIVNVAFYDDDVQNFLDIMPLQIGRNPILCEVPLYKRSGGRFNEAAITKKVKKYLCCCCRNWRRRYFTVTDHGVFYCQKKKSFNIKQMLPYSSQFRLSYGMNMTGDILGVTINSDYRTLELSAGSIYQFILFLKCINTALIQCPYKQSQRYQSFSGTRENCFANAYVDGQDYFTDLCHELLSAKKHVYITDWMLTPYFLLRRPTELDDRSSRLDYVLESIASRGVKVYIILYMQPQIALNNDSQFVQKYLTQLNPNIKVLRHPNYLLIPFLWSHHQKMVSIDQRIAFMGGLDICYGRWDNAKHYLTQKKSQNYWKGAQYCNLRISDIYHPRNFLISNLDAKTQPRLPWHDIGVSLRGGSVIDLERHFVQYWNFVSFQTKFDDRQLLLHAGRHSIAPQKFDFKRILPHKLRQKLQQDANQQTKRNMHQHEQQSMNDDELSFYREHLSHNFSAKDNIMSMFEDLPNLNTFKKYPKKFINFLKEGEYQADPGNRLIMTEEIKQKAGTQTHQVLRSASTWSMGLDQNHAQASIHEAYVDLIKNAKQFIYIENQFFVSKQNGIVAALIERIRRAYQSSQRFKVMIMIPLLPAFQGHVDSDSSVIMKAQLHWQYLTINRSKNSLMQKLSDIPNLSEYLNFYSLRNHGVTKIGKPVTEMIYIHSKLMIVDDTKVILGSANINDRSMLGDRDSELAILIEGGQTLKITIKPTKNEQHQISRYVTKFAHDLRVKLFMEHTGLSRDQVDDFLSNLLWKKIAQRARTNTLLYRQIFGCYPDDTILKLTDLQKLIVGARVQNYNKLSKQIKGHIVQFPLKFLQKENIGLSANSKEYFILPQINFL